MHNHRALLASATLLALWGCDQGGLEIQDLSGLSSYDSTVLLDSPVAYLAMNSTESEADLTGNGHGGAYFPAGATRSPASLPNGDLAADFNGRDQYLEIPNAAALSIATTGKFSFEAWIRPDVLEFPNEEGSGYVYWAGKGAASQYEYALRMYSTTNSESPSRPNRISGYAFNLSGGLGSGSYFQDPVTAGQWIHVVVTFNTQDISKSAPTGTVKVYKNGVLRDTTALSQYSIVPAAGTAPLRIGTRNSTSFFAGAVGKVAVYDFELSAAQALAHTNAMLSH